MKELAIIWLDYLFQFHRSDLPPKACVLCVFMYGLAKYQVHQNSQYINMLYKLSFVYTITPLH